MHTLHPTLRAQKSNSFVLLGGPPHNPAVADLTLTLVPPSPPPGPLRTEPRLLLLLPPPPPLVPPLPPPLPPLLLIHTSPPPVIPTRSLPTRISPRPHPPAAHSWTAGSRPGTMGPEETKKIQNRKIAIFLSLKLDVPAHVYDYGRRINGVGAGG